MAVERQLAPLVDRLALGGKDDGAVEDQPPGANALDDLWHTRREPHEIAIFLHQRVGNALFEREARLFVHVADLAMHRQDELRAQPAVECGEFGLPRMAADMDKIGRESCRERVCQYV